MKNAELATCDNCKEKKMMQNPDEYCIGCRKKIRNRMRSLRGSRHSGHNGRYVYRRHKDSLRHNRFIEEQILGGST